MLTVLCEGMSALEAVSTFIRKYIYDKLNEYGEYDDVVYDIGGEYIVRLAPLYEFENPERAIPDNEYVNIDNDGNCYWEYDWDEGQTKVLLYGITPLEEVTPLWEL